MLQMVAIPVAERESVPGPLFPVSISARVGVTINADLNDLQVLYNRACAPLNG